MMMMVLMLVMMMMTATTTTMMMKVKSHAVTQNPNCVYCIYNCDASCSVD